MNLAIIPARGGSKRIPRKNIRPFCGKPMIVWSIEAAGASDLFEHIVVSTDDDEIAEVACAHGAGQFYWGRTEAFLSDRDTFSATSLPIIRPRYRVHDIDTEEDWRRAELVFQAIHDRSAAVDCIKPKRPGSTG